jgi:PAS domain-containing protein
MTDFFQLHSVPNEQRASEPVESLFQQFRSLYGVEYLVADEKFVIVNRSDGMERFEEVPRSLMLGQSLFEGLPELIGFETELQAVLTQQQPQFELKLLSRSHSNGQFLYFDLYAVYSSQGQNSAHLTLFLVDVTQQAQFERTLVQGANEATFLSQQLRSSKNYMEQLLYSIPNAIIATTYAGTIKLSNALADKLFGYAKDELINQSIATCIPSIKPMFLSFSEANPKLFSCQLLKNVEIIGYTRTQEPIQLLVSCSSIQSANSLFQGWVFTLQQHSPLPPAPVKKQTSDRYNQYVHKRPDTE